MDAKSAALLTHVSVMLAVVVVLLSTVEATPWRIVMGLELFAFSAIGMALLRCVDIMGPPLRQAPAAAEDLANMYLREVQLRRAIYQFVVRMVFACTLVLIVCLVVKGWLFLVR